MQTNIVNNLVESKHEKEHTSIKMEVRIKSTQKEDVIPKIDLIYDGEDNEDSGLEESTI